MAITQSAKKVTRASARKKVFNDARKNKVKDTVKNIQKLVKEKKLEEAQEELSKAYKVLDKAAKGHTIKKGNASRKKSRLAKLIKKISV